MKTSIAKCFNTAAGTYDAAALLHREVGERLFDRLKYMKLAATSVLDLGSNTGYFTNQLQQHYPNAACYGIDIAFNMTKQAKANHADTLSFVNADAENLPFADNAFDLIFSALVLQWCPNLATTIQALRRHLKPNGLFLFATYGPDTLQELRYSFSQVDEQRHVNEFVDMHDLGDMLLAAKFSDPVVDMETITVKYPSVRNLLKEIKAVGASHINAAEPRKTLTGKNRWQSMEQEYERFKLADGKYPATYEIIYGAAWGPSLTVDHTLDESGEVIIPLSHIAGLSRRR